MAEDKRLEKGKFYFIKLKHYGRELEYKCKIMWIHKSEFRMQTDGDTRLRFKLKQIFYVKEISEKEFGKKEYALIKIKKKRQFIPKHKLKKQEEPKGLIKR